jgi:hypothetical protein
MARQRIEQAQHARDHLDRRLGFFFCHGGIKLDLFTAGCAGFYNMKSAPATAQRSPPGPFIVAAIGVAVYGRIVAPFGPLSIHC